jgi:hypothetical protein
MPTSFFGRTTIPAITFSSPVRPSICKHTSESDSEYEYALFDLQADYHFSFICGCRARDAMRMCWRSRMDTSLYTGNYLGVDLTLKAELQRGQLNGL